ncbi:MAG TPA: TonB family protein [Steroidobacteraceae bacterium]|nr:TonB family protein [Steroidobacteraceae bacterium]
MNPAPSKRGPTLAGLVGLREAGAPVRERLMSMLFLAGIAHGIIILGLSFSAGGSSGPAPGMQVLLVTEDLPEARSNERAIYLAQRTQLGSGNTRTLLTGGPLSHPAPRSSASSGNDESSSPESAAPGTPRTLATPAPAPLILWLGETGEGAAARRSAQMAKAEPESHGRGDARELVLRGDPKTGQWISPDTRASNLAPYLDAWRRKIERLGTLNFPSAARRGELSGSPVIEVTLGQDGRLLDASVQRGSGYPQIDQAALDILRLASPFEPFPRLLARDYTTLRFAYQWEFVNGALAPGTVTTGTNVPRGP